MHKKNTIKLIICHGLVALLFCIKLAQASDTDLCDFNGFITGPSQWEEVEFSNLLKSEHMPGYHLMTAIIGKIAIADNNILKSSSCKVSKYVVELIKFYNSNEAIIRKKHSDIADLLDYIKINLNE